MALYGCPLSVTERVERRRAAAFSQRDSRPRLTSTISSASEASCSAASSFKIYKTTQTRSWRQMKHAAFIASKLCPLAIIRIISDRESGTLRLAACWRSSGSTPWSAIEWGSQALLAGVAMKPSVVVYSADRILTDSALIKNDQQWIRRPFRNDHRLPQQRFNVSACLLNWCDVFTLMVRRSRPRTSGFSINAAITRTDTTDATWLAAETGAGGLHLTTSIIDVNSC